MPPVGGPPLLGVGHDLDEVRLDRGEVQLLKGFRVVEVVAHRVGRRAVHTEDVEVELVRPPIGVPGAAAGPVVELAVEEGTLGSVRHRIEVHIRLGFALSNLGAFKPKPTPKAKVETKAGRQGHPSHRSGPKIHPRSPFRPGPKEKPDLRGRASFAERPRFELGDQNIGHSLAGCCITTLPPLRGAFPSESGPRIYRKPFGDGQWSSQKALRHRIWASCGPRLQTPDRNAIICHYIGVFCTLTEPLSPCFSSFNGPFACFCNHGLLVVQCFSTVHHRRMQPLCRRTQRHMDARSHPDHSQ